MLLPRGFVVAMPARLQSRRILPMSIIGEPAPRARIPPQAESAPCVMPISPTQRQSKSRSGALGALFHARRRVNFAELAVEHARSRRIRANGVRRGQAASAPVLQIAVHIVHAAAAGFAVRRLHGQQNSSFPAPCSCHVSIASRSSCVGVLPVTPRPAYTSRAKRAPRARSAYPFPARWPRAARAGAGASGCR